MGACCRRPAVGWRSSDDGLVRSTEPTRAWVPPDGWPASPAGWAPGLGWQPDPSWPPVPPGHQWWQPTPRGRRRRRTAIALVGLSSSAGLLYSMYRIVVVTLEGRALHAGHGWYQPHSLAIHLLLGFVWLCSMALLIPAGSIGAAELWEQGRSGRARAAAFVAVLCVGVSGQYWVSVRAEHSRGPTPFAGEAWLHDGRSWFALMCVLVIVVFAVTVTLLKSPGDDARLRPSASVT